jgi:GNAT superfamily N-acetyltransferase
MVVRNKEYDVQQLKDENVPSTFPYKIVEATSEQTQTLDTRIDKFNAEELAFTGTLEAEKNYAILDEEGNLMAGITSRIYLKECLYVYVLFVNEDKRKQGLGSILLKTLEQEALSLGVKLIHLSTFDFQAKDFYLKHGYEFFGVLDDCPTGHKRYYMKNVL